MFVSWLKSVEGSPYQREVQVPQCWSEARTVILTAFSASPLCRGETVSVLQATPGTSPPAWTAPSPSSCQNPAHCSRPETPPSPSWACPPSRHFACRCGHTVSCPVLCVLVLPFSVRAVSPSVHPVSLQRPAPLPILNSCSVNSNWIDLELQSVLFLLGALKYSLPERFLFYGQKL